MKPVPLVCANWKMHVAPSEASAFAEAFVGALDEGPEEGTPIVEEPPETLQDGDVVRLAAP